MGTGILIGGEAATAEDLPQRRQHSPGDGKLHRAECTRAILHHVNDPGASTALAAALPGEEVGHDDIDVEA